jgi:hypothetical protein
LRRALIEEIVLVTLAHVVFLMHFRSILIVTIPLPLAVLISFLGMYYGGISSNIMSLAGIAIAIGVLVDAGIVVTENAFRFIEQRAVDLATVVSCGRPSWSRHGWWAGRCSSPWRSFFSRSSRCSHSPDRKASCSTRSPLRRPSPCSRPRSSR